MRRCYCGAVCEEHQETVFKDCGDKLLRNVMTLRSWAECPRCGRIYPMSARRRSIKRPTTKNDIHVPGGSVRLSGMRGTGTERTTTNRTKGDVKPEKRRG